MPEISFPSGLKVLCIPYYDVFQAVQEDLELARALKVRSFPSLEAVVIPSKGIVRNGYLEDTDEFKKRWLEGRRELEKAEVFQSGKVELRPIEPGESSEYKFRKV